MKTKCCCSSNNTLPLPPTHTSVEALIAATEEECAVRYDVYRVRTSYNFSLHWFLEKIKKMTYSQATAAPPASGSHDSLNRQCSSWTGIVVVLFWHSPGLVQAYNAFVLSLDVGNRILKWRHIQVEYLQTGSRVKVSCSLLFSSILQLHANANIDILIHNNDNNEDENKS